MSNKKETIICIPDIHSTDKRSCEIMVNAYTEVCKSEVIIQSDDFGNVQRRKRTKKEKKEDLEALNWWKARLAECERPFYEFKIADGLILKYF